MYTFKYVGSTYKNCDPGSDVKAGVAAAKGWATTVKQNYANVFGLGSKLYNSLNAATDQVIAKGREAMGYTAKELALKDSQVLSGTAAAIKAGTRAVQAHGASSSAVAGVDTGATTAARGQVVTNAETAATNKIADITEAGYATQREAYDTAMKEKEGSLGASFSPSTAMSGEVGKAVSGQLDAAQQANSDSTSWMGAIGGIANSAIGAAGTAAGCPVAGSMILMADGSEIPVQFLEVGDRIMGIDGEPCVIENVVEEKSPTTIVRFENGLTTHNSLYHGFVLPKGGFTLSVKALGKTVMTELGPSVVSSVEIGNEETVYDILTDGSHTYQADGVWALGYDEAEIRPRELQK